MWRVRCALESHGRAYALGPRMGERTLHCLTGCLNVLVPSLMVTLRHLWGTCSTLLTSQLMEVHEDTWLLVQVVIHITQVYVVTLTIITAGTDIPGDLHWMMPAWDRRPELLFD